MQACRGSMPAHLLRVNNLSHLENFVTSLVKYAQDKPTVSCCSRHTHAAATKAVAKLCLQQRCNKTNSQTIGT